jgi:Tol biopolymer transport system component
MSPDGNQLAIVARQADGRQRLWLRPLEELEARELPGTDGAVAPFWSPDNRSVAFFADGKLKKIDIGGGQPVTLCSVASFNSGSWSTQGVIVFSRAAGSAGLGGGPLLKVPQSGGVPTAATTLRDDEAAHLRPSFLPDGRHFLYRMMPVRPGASSLMYVGSLDSNDRVEVREAIGNVSYSRGHLLFVRESTLMAQPFDVQRLTLTGDPLPVADQIQTTFTGIPVGAFSVSENGVLAYQTGTSAENGMQLTWLDRAGKAVGIVGGRARYNDIELSPDGRQAAVSIPREQRRDVWLIDLARGVPTRFTFDDSGAQTAVWSPDGTRVVFNTLRGGVSNLSEKSAGGGPEQPLLTGEGFKVPLSWSSDGRFVLYSPRTPGTDLWVLPMFGDRKPFPLFPAPVQNEGAPAAQSRTGELLARNFGRFSPDGRWVAYVSNESGAPQVYVVPFPDANNGKWQISPAGGTQPRWRRDGKEIFYVNDDALMAATVDAAGAGLQIGAAQPLFKFRNPGMNRSYYDVAPDGQRFLFETRVEDTGSPSITVVVNWDRK